MVMALNESTPRDFSEWAKRAANVRTAGGRVVPFVPNPGQKKALKTSPGLRGVSGYYPFVKGRQGGFTTFFLLYILYLCITRPNFSVLIVCSNEEPVGLEVIAKWRRLIAMLSPASGFMGLRNDNKQETIFECTNSRVSWAHIGATDTVAEQVGRAGTFDLVLLTEFGFVHDSEFARIALEALEPAIERSGAPVLIDSTPGRIPGTGDAYAELIRAVHTGAEVGECCHIGWWMVEESLHRRRVLKSERAEFIASLTDEELRLMRDHAPLIDLERIAWRRSKINRGGMSRARALRRFKLAYPESVTDALLTTEDEEHVFDGEVIKELKETDARQEWPAPAPWISVRSEIPDKLGYDLLCKHKSGLSEREIGEGYCRIWSFPHHEAPSATRGASNVTNISLARRQRFEGYFAGIDTSDGRAGGDWQVCTIVDQAGATAARLRTKIDPVRFAAYCQRLLEWYRASAVVEAPHGALVYRLIMGRHIGIEAPGAQRGELEALARPYEGPCHFQPTTGANRDAIVAAGMAALESGGCLDRETFLEMIAFKRDPRTGKLQASRGAHDDIIMSLGLAQDCRRAAQQRRRTTNAFRTKRRSRRTKYSYLR